MAAIPPLGASDCEAIRDGFLAQPANAISSFAFTAVGAAVLMWAAKATGFERRYRLVLGTTLAVAGVGSFLYHGPQAWGAAEAHDWSLLALVIVVGVTVALAPFVMRASVRWSIVGLAVVASIATSEASGATNAVFVGAIGLTVASDIVAHRGVPRPRGLYASVVVASVLAVGSFVVGRSGGVFCVPDSAMQFHALWHVLAAIAMGLYALASERIRARILP